jgi:anamorsin
MLATVLQPGAYAAIHVAIAQNEYNSMVSNLQRFLSQLLAALAPQGTLDLSNAPSSLDSELKLAGYTVLLSETDSHRIVAQKPAHQPGASAPAMLLKRNKTDPAKKKALWTLSAPTATTIDSDSLLTAADRERPTPACEPVTKGAVPKRKKACKNCSCGLAELEAEELKNSKIVVLDAEGQGTIEVDQAERDRMLQAAGASTKATSSCGSCFLGDAFRCASCPYLGMFYCLFSQNLLISCQAYLHSSLERKSRSISGWTISEQSILFLVFS